LGSIRRIIAVGTVHTGEIAEIVDKGATVEFGEDIVAFIPTRHLEKKTVEIEKKEKLLISK
jgi:small subunit ribosomal protein S1